ncbi:unnamed protein product, partial [Ectocarpus fasciculatus]
VLSILLTQRTRGIFARETTESNRIGEDTAPSSASGLSALGRFLREQHRATGVLLLCLWLCPKRRVQYSYSPGASSSKRRKYKYMSEIQQEERPGGREEEQ